MHIKNKKDVSQGGTLGFISLRKNAKMWIDCKTKKKYKTIFVPNPTHLQFSHQEMDFTFFTTLICVVPVISFG